MSKKIEITLSDSIVANINEVMKHKREGANFNSVVLDAIEQGVYQQLYRFERNKKKWQETKDNKQLLNQLLAERKQRELTKKD